MLYEVLVDGAREAVKRSCAIASKVSVGYVQVEVQAMEPSAWPSEKKNAKFGQPRHWFFREHVDYQREYCVVMPQVLNDGLHDVFLFRSCLIYDVDHRYVVCHENNFVIF